MSVFRKYPAPQPGYRYGILTIKYPNVRRGRERYCWATCDCGAEKLVRFAELPTGVTKSCGCLRKQRLASGEAGKRNVTHGQTKNLIRSSEWNIWASMRQRCENQNHRAYAYYGGRGIKVCERWKLFENFFADMGERPTDDLSIDRIDPDGNYEPSNCRWATRMEQRHNRSKRLH